MSQRLFCVCLVFFLASCSYGRYQQRHDSIPTRVPTQAELQDAVPRDEPLSRGGNKDYQVFGQHYQVLTSTENFTETGGASWYGEKFHGHLTSNGEIYNMYSMSAAHKNLPLPSYIEVTNLENNKKVIVRVNDRGPFHEGRIIDLSYSAAYKLDMLSQGTAKVSIRTITAQQATKTAAVAKATKQATIVTNTAKNTSTRPAKAGMKKTSITAPSLPTDTQTDQVSIPQYIQAFATKDLRLAENTVSVLSSLYQQKSHYRKKGGIYRIHIGPIDDHQHLEYILASLKNNGYPHAFKH